MWSYTFIESLQYVRHSFFEYLGTKRYLRILFIAWVIAAIWIFADWRSGSLTVNLWDDLICLLLAIVAERLIPWGKD